MRWDPVCNDTYKVIIRMVSGEEYVFSENYDMKWAQKSYDNAKEMVDLGKWMDLDDKRHIRTKAIESVYIKEAN